MKINDLCKIAYDSAAARGFHEPVQREDGTVRMASPVERMALVHTEISEAVECLRTHTATDIWHENGKPEGYAIELADAVIRICEECQLVGVNLEQAIETKLAYNATRPHRHGKKF